jgi:histidinol-phosphatase (PHP family)
MLAHFDRIFATGASRFGPPDIDRLEGDIRPVLRALVDRDRTLEINTRFLCHEPDWNDSLVTVLRWYREAGGTKVELNSDAHRASEIGRHMAVGEELLGEAGLEQSNNASFGVRLPS